jgi:release factor glutamine methyltransferase
VKQTLGRDQVVIRLRAAGCVFAEEEAALLLDAAGPDTRALAALLARRERGEPLEHLLECVEFDGLRLVVTAGVFVPRRRTEALVEQAARRTPPGAVVLDLCCGCGALGAALLARVGGLELHASDVEPAAVRCARRNLPGATVHLGDLFDPLPDRLRGRVGTLLANTPYVPSGDIALMPPEARDHEPSRALDGGPDGLDVQRRVASAAAGWLAPGGHLLVETSRAQAPVAAGLLAEHGLRPSVVHDEERDATVVLGRRPS